MPSPSMHGSLLRSRPALCRCQCTLASAEVRASLLRNHAEFDKQFSCQKRKIYHSNGKRCACVRVFVLSRLHRGSVGCNYAERLWGWRVAIPGGRWPARTEL